MLNIQGFDCSATSSMRWKAPYLEEAVTHAAEWYAIISITETWIKPHIEKAQLSIAGYNLHRSDRIKRERGGCCLYIHESLPVTNEYTFDNDFCEVVACTISSEKTLVFSGYRPGDTPHDKFNEALDFIRLHLDDKGDDWTVFITGDFNFPNINWDTFSIKSNSHGCTICAKSLLQLVESNLLAQVVDKPTRTASGDTANILDIVITNRESETIKEVEVTPTILSDHDFVSIVIPDVFRNPSSRRRYTNSRCYKELPLDHFNSLDFRKADFDKINEELEKVDWDNLKESCTTQTFPELFHSTVLTICSKYTPLKKLHKKQKSRYHKACYSINRKRRKVKSRMKALQSLCPSSNMLTSLKNELVKLEKEAQEKILHCKELEEERALKAIKTNPNYFYSYTKHKKSVKSKVGPLHCTSTNSYVDNPKDMADILQNQFTSVFSNPENVLVEEASIEPVTHSTLDDIECTEEDLSKAIDEIKENSASGDEGFSALVLKACKQNLTYPLFLLWSTSMETGFIHQMYLHQLITPIYKGKGSKCKAPNYRPISLTSHIVKAFERVIRKKLVAYLEDNNLISPNQHGFRKGRSCLSELLHHHDDVLLNGNSGEGTDIIYLDFAKAFDKVDHKLLLNKLKKVGIGGKLLNWFKAFLSNRKQEVVIEGFKSWISDVLSGVPQGSVLGPILFIIFINDMADSLQHSKLKSFADDTKISRSISNQNDAIKLQEDLNCVLQWSKDNNMVLNGDKFEFLKHNYKFDSLLMELPESYFNSCYKANSALIECSDVVKDLGITFDSKFSFDEHIGNIVKQASNKSAWILSVFRTRSKSEMMFLYKTYVRPNLEYCCPLWNPSGPNSVTSIQKIEAVQRTFTSKINTMQGLNYWERLNTLDLMSLQRRRERYIIIYMWKILTSQVPNDLQVSFYMNHRSAIKAVVPQIPTQRSNATLFDKSFSVLGPKLWNILPKDCTLIMDSLESFKRHLGVFMSEFQDLPPTSGYFSPNSNSLLDWFYSRSDGL